MKQDSRLEDQKCLIHQVVVPVYVGITSNVKCTCPKPKSK